MSRLGKRDKEENEIEMDQLRAEIKNVKINGDKMMGLLEELREQRKGSYTAPEESKPRSAAIEEDRVEDEVRDMVRGGLELI